MHNDDDDDDLQDDQRMIELDKYDDDDLDDDLLLTKTEGTLRFGTNICST
jgi:hypothetical protein